MFEIGWQEIMVVGAVALIVVGPKELPTLLRTIGKYVGLIKRQASEFRAQFDEAMRESELDKLKKDVESIKTEAESTLRDVERSVETEVTNVKSELDSAATSINGSTGDPYAMHDADGLPFPGETPAIDPPRPTGPGAAAIAAAAAAASPVTSATGGAAAAAAAAAESPVKAGA